MNLNIMHRFLHKMRFAIKAQVNEALEWLFLALYIVGQCIGRVMQCSGVVWRLVSL